MSVSGVIRPEAMSISIRVDLYRTRRMKAKLLPSGEGVGRIAPPGPVDVGVDLAGLPVEPLDDVDLAVDVLRIFENLAWRRVVGEIEVAAVGREGGLVGVLLLGARLGHLHAVAAAGAVIEPHFARAQRARRGEMLARDEVIAVGRPVGLVEQAEVLLGDLPRVPAIAVHRPDIVAAAAIGGEGDLAAVGRIARLHFPRMAGSDRARLAAARSG